MAQQGLDGRRAVARQRLQPSLVAQRERGEKADHTNTVVFQLTAKCERDADGEEQGKSVHSKSLEWLPLTQHLPRSHKRVRTMINGSLLSTTNT